MASGVILTNISRIPPVSRGIVKLALGQLHTSGRKTDPVVDWLGVSGCASRYERQAMSVTVRPVLMLNVRFDFVVPTERRRKRCSNFSVPRATTKRCVVYDLLK